MDYVGWYGIGIGVVFKMGLGERRGEISFVSTFVWCGWLLYWLGCGWYRAQAWYCQFCSVVFSEMWAWPICHTSGVLDPIHGSHSTTRIAFPESGFFCIFLSFFLTSVETDCTGTVLGGVIESRKALLCRYGTLHRDPNARASEMFSDVFADPPSPSGYLESRFFSLSFLNGEVWGLPSQWHITTGCLGRKRSLVIVCTVDERADDTVLSHYEYSRLLCVTLVYRAWSGEWMNEWIEGRSAG